MIKISVAICTWNRSRLLRKTLQQFTRLNTAADFEWELVVVNNHSLDDTASVIADFSNRLPIIAVEEPRPGHSHCRNRAIDIADGDYIVWTDNDVLVDPQWLMAYHQAFRAEPEVAFFGGPIEPFFESPGRPAWLEDTWEKCKAVYATRLLGDAPIALTKSLLPYGANFALPMSVQRDHRYNSSLGRVGSEMLGDDETSVLRQIADQGGKGRWVPSAKIKHVIPNDRATESYVSKYFVGQGQTNVLQGKCIESRWKSLRTACWYNLLYRSKRRRASADEWVSHMIQSSIAWGEFRQQRIQCSRNLSSSDPATALANSP